MTTKTSSDFALEIGAAEQRTQRRRSRRGKGKAFTLAVALFLISPPIAKLCPSNSWTVVDARRVVMSGRTAVPSKLPVAVMPTPSRSSETSGATLRLIRPPARTVGVDF
ncbi:MAG: hypothetical protein R3E45_07190 [Rhodocyclaceae bacterium]